MKSTFYIPFLLIALTLGFWSCSEDEYADWKMLNDKWYEEHKNDDGFKMTESGLCYKVIHQGYHRRPNIASTVYVKYTGRFIDGTKFEETTGTTISLSSSIKGWMEGLQMMNGGGRYIFYIPANLAYGEEGSGSIPPHSVLIFDIELLDSY